MKLKGSDEWLGRTDYAQTFFKRATGELPEMESSKAVATILAEEVQAHDSILDVGCGAGHYLRSLKRGLGVPFSYTGVDRTPAFIDTGVRAWKGVPDVNFRLGDVYELPYESGSFDVVMCNNVLLHLPSIVKPVAELLRVARRLVLVRTLIGDRSFRIQEVYSEASWPFSDVAVSDEFDDAGEPRSFGYENIYSRAYFTDVVRRVCPQAGVEFVEDTFFDPEAINASAQSEGLPNATRVIDGMQVLGYVITPWHFVLMRPRP